MLTCTFVQALDNLATTNLMLGENLLAGAQEMMDEVVKVRKERLGPENVFTLMALANRARIKLRSRPLQGI